jgi:hypothetical protein
MGVKPILSFQFYFPMQKLQTLYPPRFEGSGYKRVQKEGKHFI